MNPAAGTSGPWTGGADPVCRWSSSSSTISPGGNPPNHTGKAGVYFQKLSSYVFQSAKPYPPKDTMKSVFSMPIMEQSLFLNLSAFNFYLLNHFCSVKKALKHREMLRIWSYCYLPVNTAQVPGSKFHSIRVWIY